MKTDVEQIQPGLYDKLEAEVRQTLGLRPDSSKPLVARYVAQQLVERDIVPAFVEMYHTAPQRQARRAATSHRVTVAASIEGLAHRPRQGSVLARCKGLPLLQLSSSR